MAIRKSSFVAILFVLLTASPTQGFAGYNIHPEFQETTFSCSSKASIISSTSFLSRSYSTIASKFTAISASTENNPLEDVSSESSSDNIDWKEISESVFSKDKRPVILFDGVCNLCNGGVNFALDNDSVGNFRFVSLQSKVGKALLLRAGKKSDDLSSIVLVEEETSYFKSDAVLRIAAKLDGNSALPILGNVGPLFPKFVRNAVYDVVAKNRYRFGESESCRFDTEEFDDRFIPDPGTEI